VVVDEVHAVQAAFAEVIHQCARQFGGGGVGRIVGQFLVILRRGFSGLLHGFRHLASDAVHGDIGIAVGPEGFQRETDDIGIESAAKGRVGRESDEGDFLPGRCRIFILDRGPGRPFGSPRPTGLRHEPLHHLLQFPLVGTHSLDGLLRLAELGGGHELHRRSDLQRTLDGADTALYFL
jgi:hypothetical protein